MDLLGGLLLAGGRSTRFGSDKALAVVGGMTLLARAEACLREACDGPILVASGDGVSRPGVGDGQVADVVPDAGPLSAIAAGLHEHAVMGSTWVAVLAVDHIAPSPEVLRYMRRWRGGFGVGDVPCWMPTVEDRDQPLHALWATSFAEKMAADVRAGQRSVLGWLASNGAARLDGASLVAAGIDLRFAQDVDRPTDLPG